MHPVLISCLSLPFSHQLKYKAEYVKQRGHYVGVPSMRDDPKLVWFEHAGEIQNDRLYKSDYQKTKSKIHIPPDMVSVVAAKEGQNLVSDVEYRQYLHEWTCHPDQNDCIQARKAYDLQSDVSGVTDVLYYRMMELLRLEKTFEVISSNHDC